MDKSKSAIDLVKSLADKASLKSRAAQREAAKWPKGFKDDFELVANHYQLRECGEYDLAVKMCKDNPENCIRCYTAIANSLRMNKAQGINERIRKAINESR